MLIIPAFLRETSSLLVYGPHSENEKADIHQSLLKSKGSELCYTFANPRPEAETTHKGSHSLAIAIEGTGRWLLPSGKTSECKSRNILTRNPTRYTKNKIQSLDYHREKPECWANMTMLPKPNFSHRYIAPNLRISLSSSRS